jgi:hypothetical protein
MPTTSTSIANSALAKVGAERIASLNDASTRAILCLEQYEKIRDELLYSHPWNFAIGRVELTPLVDQPLYEFAYQYQLPADVLRVIGTDIPGMTEWNVEGRLFLCNFTPVKLKYIKQVTEEALFTPGFSEAFAAKLAAEICYALTQSSERTALLQKEAEFKIRQARSFNGQESLGDRVYADSWLNSRA